MEKKKYDCHKMHTLMLILFYGGITLLAFSYIWAEKNQELSPICVVLSIIAVCAMVMGLIICYTAVNCPHCGKSLTGGGRVPNNLPVHCPHCGEKV